MIDALDDPLPNGRRRLKFTVALPGYAGPRKATIAFIEEWLQSGDVWSLARYRFDYLRDPKGSGRRAHHLHPLHGQANVPHAHCEDPQPLHPHYRDVEVTILEAAGEFTRVHAVGKLRCDDLFPLYV